MNWECIVMVWKGGLREPQSPGFRDCGHMPVGCGDTAAMSGRSWTWRKSTNLWMSKSAKWRKPEPQRVFGCQERQEEALVIDDACKQTMVGRYDSQRLAPSGCENSCFLRNWILSFPFLNAQHAYSMHPSQHRKIVRSCGVLTGLMDLGIGRIFMRWPYFLGARGHHSKRSQRDGKTVNLAEMQKQWGQAQSPK